jgi:hypothetical protein
MVHAAHFSRIEDPRTGYMRGFRNLVRGVDVRPGIWCLVPDQGATDYFQIVMI